MERDELRTLEQLKARRRDVIDPLVVRHQGRIFKDTGDGVLVEFGSAVDAVECAAAVQQAMAAANATSEGRPIVIRVGVNLGDIMVEGDDLFGDGVNVAARLEGLAEPGGVAISDSVHQHVGNRVGVEFVDRGKHEVKNMERAVHVWAWSPGEQPTRGTEPTRSEGHPPLPHKPSIAVLPFDNMSGDPEQGYFADGITEDIITDLSKVSGLFVIARNSTFAYKGQAPDIRTVSRDLGVRYVLEGSVRRAAGRVRINAQMIDGTTGGHLWAERYDRNLEDIFAVQDEVTRTIVAALKVQLTPGEEAIRGPRGKVDPEAYDLLVRAGQTMLRLQPDAAAEARRMLERVIEIDPGLALAYARLSMITFADYANQWNGATAENLGRALELARKAVDTDPNEPQGYISLALALAWMRDLDEAARAAEHALALDPNSGNAHAALGNMREFQGRPEEAVLLYETAYRLDPQFDMTLHFLGRALLSLGRYAEAEAAFRRRLGLTPRSDMSRFYLACLLGSTARREEARRVWGEMMAVNPGFSVEHLRRALPYRDPRLLDRVMAGLHDAGIAS
jgi:adenylate cyclase